MTANLDLEGFCVLLDNLPWSFTDATLKSIIEHVQCKGKVLSTTLFPEGEKAAAQVLFEKPDDADAAIRLWDQLTIDGAIITAASAPESKRRAQGAKGASNSPVASTYRYPFATMNIGWLVEYINGLKNPDRSITMCRVLECLMVNAVATADAFLESAVVMFYTKFSSAAWGKAQCAINDSVTFELSRQVFEVIGLVKKYPGANAKSRKMLLSLVERVIDDIGKVSITSKALAVNKAIPEILSSIRTNITALRLPSQVHGGGGVDAAATAATSPPAVAHELLPLDGLLSWLKFLFSCLSSHYNQIPTFPEVATVTHCSENCPCFARIRSRYTIFPSDVDKAKVIDCLIISAVKDNDEQTCNIAIQLLHRNSIDFCARAVAHAHNGPFAVLRMLLFQSVELAKRFRTMAPAQHAQSYDTIEISVLKAREAILLHEGLKSLMHLVDNALACLSELRQSPPSVPPSAAQQFYTMQFDLVQIFTALCSPCYQLCLHHGLQPAAAASSSSAPKSAVAGRPQNHCANPSCATGLQALLKCSRCQAAYYCSQDCQKADWRVHRTMCKEIAAKKAVGTTPQVVAQPTLPLPSVQGDADCTAGCGSSNAESCSLRICPAIQTTKFQLPATGVLDEATFFSSCHEILAAAVHNAL